MKCFFFILHVSVPTLTCDLINILRTFVCDIGQNNIFTVPPYKLTDAEEGHRCGV